MIGVSATPVSKPICLSAAIILCALCQSRSRRSGSRSMMSSAAMTDATDAGGGLAEKIRGRDVCFM